MIIKSENVDLLNLESKEDGEENSHMWEEKIVDNEFEQEQLELLEEKINLKNFAQLFNGLNQDDINYLLEGKSLATIAREKQISRQRAYQLLEQIKKRVKNVSDRANTVHLLHKKGYDDVQIANKLRFISRDVASFYEKVYNFIYLDWPRP